MDTMNYEFWGLVMAIAGTIIAVVKIWYKWSERMAEHKEFVIEQLSKINVKTETNIKNIDDIYDDIDNIKNTESQQRKDIYNKIAEVNKMRETDMKDLTETVKKSIEKSSCVEERHHSELMVKIEKLTVQLTAMCATFDEYRKLRNGNK